MNWNLPGAISVAVPITGQLLAGSFGTVEAITLKGVPGVLVKENWNDPFGSIFNSARIGAAGAGEVTLIILLRLGMPLTKTVAKAQPGGNPVTGAEVKLVVEQLLDVSVTVHPFSMLRSCTTG